MSIEFSKLTYEQKLERCLILMTTFELILFGEDKNLREQLNPGDEDSLETDEMVSFIISVNNKYTRFFDYGFQPAFPIPANKQPDNGMIRAFLIWCIGLFFAVFVGPLVCRIIVMPYKEAWTAASGDGIGWMFQNHPARAIVVSIVGLLWMGWLAGWVRMGLHYAGWKWDINDD